jgi:DNA invertase Pin-like site-specific DNA recombinase
VDEGNSLVTQEKICKEYALKNGYEVAEIFIEQGESAKTTERTQLQRLLNYCANKKNQIVAVIAYKIDRISRNTDDYSQIRILLKRYGVQIKSTSEYFENTPAGRFMENIIANVAQFDNDVRTERSIGGMKEAMREGRYVWMAAYGYSNSKINGKKNIIPNEKAAAVRKTFELVAENVLSLEEIRQKMIREGLVHNNNKPIVKSHFYRMLRNKVYAGWIEKFGEKHKGAFEAIISDDLFEQVQFVLKGKKRKFEAYVVQNPDFPLRRFVYHPSGLKLTGSWSQGKRQKYAYYRFMLNHANYPKMQLERKFADFINSFGLDDSCINWLKENMREQFGKQTQNKRKQREEIQKRLDELDNMQRDMFEKNYKGIISDAVLKTQLASMETEQAKLKNTLYRLPDLQINSSEIIPFLQEYLKYPGEVWIKSSYFLKQKLQVFEFPSGIEFDGEIFRTPEICNLFKVKSFFLNQISPKVDFRSEISNTPDIANTIRFSKKANNTKEYLSLVQNELIDLYRKVTDPICNIPDKSDNFFSLNV